MRSGGMTAQARSSTASWSGAVVTAGSGRDQADLDRTNVARQVVDDDVRAGLGVETDVAHLDEPVVAPQLEPARRDIEVEVGDADEHAIG